jgi:hypothetical protein
LGPRNTLLVSAIFVLKLDIVAMGIMVLNNIHKGFTGWVPVPVLIWPDIRQIKKAGYPTGFSVQN